MARLISFTADRPLRAHPLTWDVIALYRPYRTFQGPFIHVGGAVFDSWKQDELVKTEALLTEDINPENPNHRALAHRALIRTRLLQWDAANDDAEKVIPPLLSPMLSPTLVYIQSIEIQPSVIGLIAKGIALVGEGKKEDAYRACDLAFKHCHSDCVDILLAIKVRSPRGPLIPLRFSCLGCRRVYGRGVC